MKGNSKAKFSQSEDDLIKALVENFGTHNWINIKHYFTNRTTRQLRERWVLYLNPNIDQTQWSKEEDDLLLEGQKIYGNAWKVISKNFLPKRTNIAIRNRFHRLARQSEPVLDSFQFSIEGKDFSFCPVEDFVFNFSNKNLY
jgi:hypothetical protein